MKSKKNTNYKKSDYITNKLLLAFTFAFLMFLFLMNISRMMSNVYKWSAAQASVKGLLIGAGAVFVFGLVLFIIEKVKKLDRKYCIFTGANIMILSAIAIICAAALTLKFDRETLKSLYIFIPALVALYIIYYSYQREFFFISLAAGIGAISIWLVASGIVNARALLLLILSGVVMLVLAALTVFAQLKKGQIKLGKRKIELFGSDARYGLVYLTFILVISLLITAFLIPDLAIYYVYGLIAYIVLTGVYYTIKLI